MCPEVKFVRLSEDFSFLLGCEEKVEKCDRSASQSQPGPRHRLTVDSRGRSAPGLQDITGHCQAEVELVVLLRLTESTRFICLFCFPETHLKTKMLFFLRLTTGSSEHVQVVDDAMPEMGCFSLRVLRSCR